MRKIKKIVAVGMAIVVSLFTGMSVSVINDYDNAYAKIDPDDEINIKYNPDYYTEYVMSRGKIKMYSQYGSMWSDLDEDDYLGCAMIRFCYLEPKKKLNNEYQAICCCQVSMEPKTVAGDVSGMSQLADIKIETINKDSRVCAPTVSALEAQESKSKSKGSSFTAGATLAYDAAKESLAASGSLSYGKTWGASTTYTYNTSNVEFIQKNKDGDYAHWNYDYVSHDGNKTWNAYLFSSSQVAGIVSYRLNSKPTASNRKKCCMREVVCDIRFGAGNIKNGKVADRLGPSTNREMAIKEVSYDFRFRRIIMKKVVIGIIIIALITGLLVFLYSKDVFYTASAQQKRFMTEIDSVNSIVWYYGNVDPGKEITINVEKVEHFNEDTIGDSENEYQYHAIVIIDFDGKMDLSDEELLYIKKCCEEKYYDLLYYGTKHLDQFKKCGYFEVLDDSKLRFFIQWFILDWQRRKR